MKKPIGLLLVLGFALAQTQPTPPSTNSPQTACPTPENANLALEKTDGFPEALKDPKVRSDTVDSMLATIWLRFVDPTFGGRDWDKISGEYKKQALEAKNERAFYDALRALSNQLDDQSGLASSTALEASAIAAQRPFTGIGTFVYSSPDRSTLTVRWVVPGGPADKAGLRARDKIVAVDNKPCPNTDKIRGPADTKVVLTVRSPGEKEREVTITRARVTFPAAVLVAKRLEANPAVGYLWLGDNSGESLATEVDKALIAFTTGSNAIKGLVLDLRGASGAGMGLMETIVAHFMETKYSFDGPETKVKRTIKLRQPDLSKLPLVVLVDKSTADSANMTAGLLQLRPNTTLIGQTTAGGARIVQNHDLPDGSILLLSEARFLRADGKPMEADKVVPTVVVDQDWVEFTEATDPYIKAALDKLK